MALHSHIPQNSKLSIQRSLFTSFNKHRPPFVYTLSLLFSIMSTSRINILWEYISYFVLEKQINNITRLSLYPSRSITVAPINTLETIFHYSNSCTSITQLVLDLKYNFHFQTYKYWNYLMQSLRKLSTDCSLLNP